MEHFPKSQWHVIAAGILSFAMLLGFGVFSLWFTHGSLLEALASFHPAESRRAPSSLAENMEDAVKYHLPYRMEIRDIYSYGLLARGKREIGSFYIVKDDGGYLHQTNLYRDPDPNIKEYARRMGKLRQSAALGGAQMLFVGTAGKYIPGINKMPGGYPQNDSDLLALDELFLNLLAYGVNNIDLREYFNMAPQDYGDYYYRTDSQWTARAAHFAASCIIGAAGDRFGVTTAQLKFYGDISNYKTDIYPDILLGDYGRSAGLPFSGLDDFVAVTPAFKTDLTLELHAQNVTRRGPFADSVLDTGFLNVTNPRYDNPMNAYFGKNVTRLRIVNHLNPEGIKVLLLCDKPFLTAAAYMALMCGEVEARIVSANDVSSMEKLASGGQYNLVIVACEAKSIGDAMFPFYKS